MYVLDYKIDNSLTPIRDYMLEGYLEYLLNKVKLPLTESKVKLASDALSCLLLNISTSRHSNKFNITLRKSDYSKGAILNGQHIRRKVSYDYTIRLLEYLEEYEYIKLIVGGHSGNKEDWGYVKGVWQCRNYKQSYVELTEKFIGILPDKFGVKDVTNVIRLKDENKRYLTFKTPEHIKPKVVFQRDYNKFSKLFYITRGDGGQIYVQSYMVFNMNFGRGGRSFMEGKNTVQAMSKEERAFVKVNGLECSCFDYHGFEIALLYTMSQEVFNGDDFYMISLEGYDQDLLKKLCKGFTLRMLNCDSEANALKSCRDFVAEEFNVEYLYNQHKTPDPRIDVQLIMKEIERKHEVVAGSFYKGIGGELQYAGSLINDYILDYFMQRGVLVIQVHDAFIAVKEHEEELQMCMRRAFVDVMGFDDNVIISKEF